jgi:hypothetical protein
VPSGTNSLASGILLDIRRIRDETDPRLPHAVIRWILQYGKDLVTCGVHWQPATSTYLVSVVPNGIEDAAMIETFASGVAALGRHAALAAALGARGWKVVAYSDARAVTDRRQRPAA